MRIMDNFAVTNEEIIKFCRTKHIKKLALFGSAVRNELTPESDIDILVEFNKDNMPGFFEFIYMERELSSLFDNRKVDLRTPGDLSHYIRQEVLKEAKVLYSDVIY